MNKTKLTSIGVVSVIASLFLGGGISRVCLFLLIKYGDTSEPMALWFLIAMIIGPMLTGILCTLLFFVGYFIVDKGENVGGQIPIQALKYTVISMFISFLYMFIEPYLY